MNPLILRFALSAALGIGVGGVSGWLLCKLKMEPEILNLQKTLETERRANAEAVADAYAEGMNKLTAQTNKFNQTSAGYRAALKEKKNEEAAALARLDTERVRVTISPPGGGPMPGAPAGAAGDSGACPTELPRTDAEFLIRLAREADEVVIKLQACQQLLEDERAQ